MKLTPNRNATALITSMVMSWALVGGDLSANQPIHLKRDVVVTGSNVMLSDIFAGIDAKTDTIVAAAPTPGKQMNIGSRDLRQIATANELSWRPTSRHALVKVMRESRSIPMKLVRSAIEQAITLELPGEDVEIEITNRRLRLAIASGHPPTVKVHDLTYDERTHHFTCQISAPADNPAAVRHSVTGRVYEMVKMPVARTHIRPGQTVRKSDITWRRVRASQATYNTISSFDELVNHTARRPLIAGRLLRRTDVQPQQLVIKGDFVTLHFRNAHMSLTTRGIALESGARDDMVRIRNTRSKKVIEGKVISPNAAVLQLPMLAHLN